MTPPKKICIVKLGAIGDVVNSLPLVNRLRAAYPQAHISWVIAPLAHGLVQDHPAVDEFVVFDVKSREGWWPFIKHLRAEEFDLVIDLQRILKSGLITRLTGAQRRMGFDRSRCKEASWLFTNERIPSNLTPGVTVAQYLEFADALGLPVQEPRWDLPLTPWPQVSPAISLGIGASKPSNLWPRKSWAELIPQLAHVVGPERVALIGGPGDREAADEILQSAPAGVLNTVGQLDLKRTAGLIAASELFVSGDTGPLHMAIATGTPVLALFGAADPTRTGPFGQADSVLYQPAECSPCRKRDCFVAGHPCMNNLSVEQVFLRIRSERDARGTSRSSSLS